MNAENLSRLADHIEAQPDDLFAMYRIGRPECGVAGCVLGHANVLFGALLNPFDFRAAQRSALFFPRNKWANYEVYSGSRHVSKERATRQLRYAAGHDRIDWSMTP